MMSVRILEESVFDLFTTRQTSLYVKLHEFETFFTTYPYAEVLAEENTRNICWMKGYRRRYRRGNYVMAWAILVLMQPHLLNNVD